MINLVWRKAVNWFVLFWCMCLKQLTNGHANRRKRLGNVRQGIKINIEFGWERERGREREILKETEQEHSVSCGILLACFWRVNDLRIHELNSNCKWCHHKMSRFSFVICVVSLTFNFISLGSEGDIEKYCGFVWKKTNMREDCPISWFTGC